MHLGDYAAALEALNKKLDLATQVNNQPGIADTNGEIGAVLFDQQSFPASLGKYESAIKFYQTVNNPLRLLFARANRAFILWRLGRYEEADKELVEIVAIATEKNQQLAVEGQGCEAGYGVRQ